MHPPRSYEFGRFRVDVVERTLLYDGREIPLTQKAFDLLLTLVERGGQIASKDELLSKVWPNQFVDEGNLTQNIYTLRKVLGETEGGRQYIETVPRRGYRFKPAVEVRRVGASGLEARADGGGAAGSREAVFNFAAGDFEPPETRYVRNGELNIAYQVVGSGPLDLVFVMGWVSHLEYFWKEESFSRFLRRLASFSRLILFDKRGTGLSDRVPPSELPTLEQRMDDVRCVLEAVGSERAALIGVSEGGPMSALFAATYPERTVALVMIGTYAKRIRSDDYPWAPSAAQRERFLEELREHWGSPIGLEERAPGKADDPQFRDWWAAYLRMGASPGAAVALTRMNAEIDVRHVLPSVRVPTLVLHRTGDKCLSVEGGRYVAGLVPGAKYVELPGEDHLPFVGDQDAVLEEVEEFLTGVRHYRESERLLATVLFARVGESPAGASGHGAERWGELIGRFRTYISREIGWFRGREVDVTKDGPLAIFDGPARAVRCACAISQYASRLGIEFQAGLHTGEIDLLGGNMVGGVAVDVGRWVSERARGGEVLVSHTVKDLVAGSGLQFEELGAEVYDEAAGRWQLFQVSVRGEG